MQKFYFSLTFILYLVKRDLQCNKKPPEGGLVYFTSLIIKVLQLQPNLQLLHPNCKTWVVFLYQHQVALELNFQLRTFYFSLIDVTIFMRCMYQIR